MKLIKPSVEILHTPLDFKEVLEQIELAARVCYKSECNIQYNEDNRSITAEPFVAKLLNVYKHRSVAEHGTIYLKIPKKGTISELNWIWFLISNPYTKFNEDNDYDYITTNYRVIVDNNLQRALKFLSVPTEKHNKRITVKFICSRACAQQLTRHRCASFSMESQRFCGYNKTKFDGSITYIYLGDGIDPIQAELYQHAEYAYMELINKGFKPQEARMVLPNATKTELVMTAFQSDWNNIFDLRCSEKADNEIKFLCTTLKNKLNAH